MKQQHTFTMLHTVCAWITFLAGTAQALSLSGRCYQGIKPDQSLELQGVNVKLFGAAEAQGARQTIDTAMTDSNGWYGLTVKEGYEHYFIVAEVLTGYTFNGASSVDGQVSSNEIHYSTVSAPLADQTLTGNKFWYTSDTPTNNPPVADADGPYTGQMGQAITLDGSGSWDPDPGDSLVSYAWDLDHDGQYDDATGLYPVHTWNTTGFYTIGLRVTDSHGAADMDSSTVTIEEIPEPNSGGGSIVVIKEAAPADDTPFWITTHYAPGGFFDILSTQLQDPSQNSTTIGNPERVTKIVEEAHAEWRLTDITVTGDTDNGSTVDLSSATVNVDYDEGEHIVIVFKNTRKETNPWVSTHVLNMCLDLDLDITGLGSVQVSANGSITEVLTFLAVGGKTGDQDSDGFDDIPVDVIAMDLHAIHPVLGPVVVGLNPNRISRGHIEERTNHTPGIIDLPTYAPTGLGDIVLDVFFEIRLPDLGMTLLAHQPKRLTTVLDFAAPPLPNTYAESPIVMVNLFDPFGAIAGTLGEITACPSEGKNDSDYGDAPDSYKTRRASGGAHHKAGPLTLGKNVDVETDGLPTVDAHGDDHTQWDDEDAVLHPSDLNLTAGASHIIALQLTNGDTAVQHSGVVTGWIDFNGDGHFQIGTEGIGDTHVSVPAASQTQATLSFTVPANAQYGTTYARFRLYGDDPNPNSIPFLLSPVGWGGVGEVEDYRIEITGSPTQQHIHGYKWHDLNGNGLWDIVQPVEPALAGWTFWLDTNHNGTHDSTDMTVQSDAIGHFIFPAVPDGTYTLGEVNQHGWQQTLPGASGTYQVTVAGGQGSFPMMFGNRQDEDPGLHLDYGDAPDPTYPTLKASNGAAHIIVPGFFLGGGVDGEPDGQPDINAWGDNMTGTDDEDGVYFLSPLIPGQPAEVEIILPAAGRLDAWIDFAGDGSWLQNQDYVIQNKALLPGSHIVTIHVPGSAAVDVTTYARFRLSTLGGLSPTGTAADGEVEDYRLLLGDSGPGEPGDSASPHLKWSQPPVEIDPNLDPASGAPIFYGWHEPARSTQTSGNKRQWRMVVDDFHCLGHIPVTRLRWWGTYKGWTLPEPPAHAQPESWHIGFWAHLEDGWATDELFSERLMWSVEVPAERVSSQPAGWVPHTSIDEVSCFVHELSLEPHEWFHQAHFPARGDIFWISITAVYPTDSEPENLWGWLTRPQPWGRAAMMPAIMGDRPTSEERLFPGRISPISLRWPCDGDMPADMAFELFTEPPWVKWDQRLLTLREWPWVTDEVSQSHEPKENDVVRVSDVADDWFCEGDTPVLAVSWQGSYLGAGYEACTREEMPVPRRPDLFRLAIRSNTSDTPGEVLWDYEANDYDEVQVGFDRHPEGDPNEAVYRYSVRLNREDWFVPSQDFERLWFQVTAVYKEALDPAPVLWGWTTRAHAFDSPALQRTEGSSWQPLSRPDGGPVDMAFTLYTAPPVPIPAGATEVATYLRDTLLEGAFDGHVLWLSPGPLDAADHTLLDLRPWQDEIAWPEAQGHWWLTLLDKTPNADWPHEVLWVFVRDDLAMYRPWASTYPPEITNQQGEPISLHCLPLELPGMGMCRD